MKEEKYGDFIGMPSVVLKLMKSDRCKEVTRNCIFEEVAFCLDPHGQIKKPCMMGPASRLSALWLCTSISYVSIRR